MVVNVHTKGCVMLALLHVKGIAKEHVEEHVYTQENATLVLKPAKTIVHALVLKHANLYP